MNTKLIKRIVTSLSILAVVLVMPGMPTGPALVEAATSPIETVRASVDSSGNQVMGASSNASISADGRYVAFESTATNLAPGDTDAISDIFVHDMVTGETKLVSRPTGTTSKGNAASTNPSISANGQYVAFDSIATNLVSPDLGGYPDVFVRDIVSNTTTRVSLSSSGDYGRGQNRKPSISSDGKYVAFESNAFNLVAGDFNNKRDIFVRDTMASTTVRVSVATGASGAEANNTSQNAAISGDGRYVAFESLASNLFTGDNNGGYDIFVRDTTLNKTTLVSVAGNGTSVGNLSSLFPSISSDGRFIAFGSASSNLVNGDDNEKNDIFLRDRDTDENGVFDDAGKTSTSLISVTSGGVQGDGDSLISSVSGDGRYVAFDSDSTNFVTADSNGFTDIFLRDRVANTTIRLSVDSGGVEPSGDNSVNPYISDDGKFVVFESTASNLVGDDTNGTKDVFIVPAAQKQTGFSRLDVSKVGSGTGTITSNPAGINCGATCLHWYADTVASVTLTAVAEADSVFKGWSGEGCSGTGTCTVNMNAGRSVTATFAHKSYIYLPFVVR